MRTDLSTFISTLRQHRDSRSGPGLYASDKVFALLDAYDDAAEWTTLRVATPAKATGGWIDAAGNNPFGGKPVWELRFRDGTIIKTCEPWRNAWQHIDAPDDILAYRQVPPSPNAERQEGGAE